METEDLNKIDATEKEKEKIMKSLISFKKFHSKESKKLINEIQNNLK